MHCFTDQRLRSSMRKAQEPVGESGIIVEQTRADGHAQPLAKHGGKPVSFRQG